MRFIYPSMPRIASFGEYLVSLSAYLAEGKKYSQKERITARLHILYVISDVLHASKYHHMDFLPKGTGDINALAKPKKSDSLPDTEEECFTDSLGEGLKPHIAQLVRLTALDMGTEGSTEEAKLRDMVDWWRESELLTSQHFLLVEESMARALDQAQGRKGKYTLPSRFGGQNTWHDLPASYMLALLARSPDRPINIDELKPIKFDKPEPSQQVCERLDQYFDSIDLHFSPDADNPTGETERYKLGLDPMGHLVKEDKATGAREVVCNGYGWSMKLCEDMQMYNTPVAIIKLREEHMDTTKRHEASRNSSSRENKPWLQQRRLSYDSDDDSEDDMDVDQPQSKRDRFDQDLNEDGGYNTKFRTRGYSPPIPPPPPPQNPAPPPPPPPTLPEGSSSYQQQYPLPGQFPNQFAGQPGMQNYPQQPFTPQFQHGSGAPVGAFTSQYGGPGFSHNYNYGNNSYGYNNTYGQGNPYGNNAYPTPYAQHAPYGQNFNNTGYGATNTPNSYGGRNHGGSNGSDGSNGSHGRNWTGGRERYQ